MTHMHLAPGRRGVEDSPANDSFAAEPVSAEHADCAVAALLGALELRHPGTGMFSVADAFDAMRNDRPYREAVSSEDALAEIERCSGTQFDPYVVSDFLSMVTVAGLPLRDDRRHLRVAG